MKPALRDPPRLFSVGLKGDITIKDCGQLLLEADEQLTLVTEGGAQYDLARKSWGFYATPSLNGRLVQFGLRAVLVRNRQSRYYLLLVERGREEEFLQYLSAEEQEIVRWLDNTASLAELAPKAEGD
jgi:hypothetical protein